MSHHIPKAEILCEILIKERKEYKMHDDWKMMIRRRNVKPPVSLVIDCKN